MDLHNQYYLVVGLSLVAGLVWLGAVLAAFGRWRAFSQRADLVWLVAFALLALVDLGRAWAAWQGLGTLETLPATAVIPMAYVVGNDVRFAAGDLIAAMVAFYAFIQKRAF